MGASQTPDPIPAPEESADAAGAGAAEQNARLSGEGEEKQEGGEEEEEEEEEVADICGSTWEVSLLERQSPRGAADGLYVYHNMFHLVPGEVGRLRRLKTLKFFANEIEVLPPEVGDLVELERLQVKVSAPGIASLPFRKLKSLSELELCHVPPRLSALSVLSEISGLKCLTKLSVSHFCIRYLPPEICNLKKLEDLDLSFNKLKNLPDDIAELGSLKSLKVANNKLIELPSSISLLSSLEKLDLSNNRLTSLTSLRLTSMFTLQHLNLQYNKLPYGCHQIPSWIRCNLEGNVEGNSKDESCKSFAIVNTHDVTVRRMHWNHSCNGLHCASSSSHSEAPPSFRCHAIKRMKRLAWKRHSCLQQRVRQERLNHSRKWKDHNHNMNIKMVEEDDSSALLQHENLHSGLQTAAKGERILDDSGKLNAPYDNFAVDSDEFCLSKNAAVVLRHDSSVMNKVGPDKNLFDEQSSCTTSSSVILDKSDNIESDTEDNSSLLQSIRAIDAPDEHSSCEVSNIIPKTKRHSDKDLDNPKPCKFRKPVEDFSNLSSKYSIQSHCSIDDYVPDGFYDAGRDRPFKPLQDFEQLSLDSREVILLDRDKDEELDAIVFSAQLLMSSLQRSNVTGIEEHAADNLRRASILALFVSDCFGGSERSTLVLKMRRSILGLQKQQPFVCTCPIGNIFENNETFRRMYSNVVDINTLCERSLRLIKESQNSNVVPIGTLRFGICRHRAVLMKYLYDRMDPPIPCELVRGYIDYMPHAWNVIHVRRGNLWLRMIVDACYPTDVREETDPEYFCRYIPLSRLHVPVRTGNPTIADAEWLFKSSLLNHVSKSKSTNSVFHYKIGTVDIAVKCKMVQAPIVSEYDMGGEGDLFKAPEAILEEPALELDPVAAAISIITCGGDVTAETMKVAKLGSVIQDDHLNDVLFYECEKDLKDKSDIKDSISELLGEKNMHAVQMNEVAAQEASGNARGSIQKSVSSGCLNSMEWALTLTMVPDHLLDLQGLDFEVALGLRRAYSDGDIENPGQKNTSIGNTNSVCTSFEQLLTIGDPKMERQQKLSRYREKKSRRNIGKKIKYACRKTLADSQLRVRGRFARTGV